MTPMGHARRLAQLANADYGTAKALDLIDELFDIGCPLDQIDAAIEEMREREGVDVEIEVEYEFVRGLTKRGWLGAVAGTGLENVA